MKEKYRVYTMCLIINVLSQLLTQPTAVKEDYLYTLLMFHQVKFITTQQHVANLIITPNLSDYF